MWVLVPVLILLLRVKGGAAADVRQLLAQGSTSLSNDDMVVGGACGLGSGCRSEVVSARALVLGKPRPSGKNCAVADENSFDSFALSDIDGATLHVMHRCEDAAGKLWDEGSGPCTYVLCAAFSWEEDGLLEYQVMVSHEVGTGEARKVSVEVYLNYDDSGLGEANSDGYMCKTSECPMPTTCEGDSVEVKVLAHDNGADGWSGRNFNVSGYSYWTLDAANPEEFSGEGFTADDGAWSGTLLKHHYMSQTRLCLPPGDYRFAAPAYVSRPDDILWNITSSSCGASGLAGGSVDVVVNAAECTVSEVVRVELAEIDDPGTGSEAMCLMPEQNPCVGSSNQLDGNPNIGIYYEEQCLTTPRAMGCSAGGLVLGVPEECRLCMVNRGQWKEENPGQRDYDIPDCPCCVAEHLAVECVTVDEVDGTVGGGVQSFFKNQKVVVVILASACGLACVIMVCYAANSNKEKKRASQLRPSVGVSSFSGAGAKDRDNQDDHDDKGSGKRGLEDAFSVGTAAGSSFGRGSRSSSRPPSRSNSRSRSRLAAAVAVAQEPNVVEAMELGNASTMVAQMEKQTQLYSLNSMDDVYGRGTEGSNPMYNPKRSRGIAATRTATNENYPERRREFSPNGRPRVGRKGNILAPEHNGKKKNNRQRSQKRNVCVSDGSSAHAVSGQRSAGDCTEIYEVYADDADKKRRGGRVKCREGAGWGVGIEGNGRAVRRSNDSGSGESEDEPAHAVPLRLQVANARGSQKLNIGKARTARAKLDQKNSSSGDDGGGGGSVEGIGSHRERSSGVVRRRTRTTGRRNQRFDSAAADDDDSASAFDAGVDDDDEYGARGYGSADGGEHPSNGTAGTIASGADDADDSGGDREGRASRESVKAKARQGYARPSSSSLTQTESSRTVCSSEVSFASEGRGHTESDRGYHDGDAKEAKRPPANRKHHYQQQQRPHQGWHRNHETNNMDNNNNKELVRSGSEPLLSGSKRAASSPNYKHGSAEVATAAASFVGTGIAPHPALLFARSKPVSPSKPPKPPKGKLPKSKSTSFLSSSFLSQGWSRERPVSPSQPPVLLPIERAPSLASVSGLSSGSSKRLRRDVRGSSSNSLARKNSVSGGELWTSRDPAAAESRSSRDTARRYFKSHRSRSRSPRSSRSSRSSLSSRRSRSSSNSRSSSSSRSNNSGRSSRSRGEKRKTRDKDQDKEMENGKRAAVNRDKSHYEYIRSQSEKSRKINSSHKSNRPHKDERSHESDRSRTGDRSHKLDKNSRCGSGGARGEKGGDPGEHNHTNESNSLRSSAGTDSCHRERGAIDATINNTNDNNVSSGKPPLGRSTSGRDGGEDCDRRISDSIPVMPRPAAGGKRLRLLRSLSSGSVKFTPSRSRDNRSTDNNGKKKSSSSSSSSSKSKNKLQVSSPAKLSLKLLRGDSGEFRTPGGILTPRRSLQVGPSPRGDGGGPTEVSRNAGGIVTPRRSSQVGPRVGGGNSGMGTAGAKGDGSGRKGGEGRLPEDKGEKEKEKERSTATARRRRDSRTDGSGKEKKKQGVNDDDDGYGPTSISDRLSISSTSSIRVPRVEATSKDRPPIRVRDALAGNIGNSGRMKRASTTKKSNTIQLDLRRSSSTIRSPHEPRQTPTRGENDSVGVHGQGQGGGGQTANAADGAALLCASVLSPSSHKNGQHTGGHEQDAVTRSSHRGSVDSVEPRRDRSLPASENRFKKRRSSVKDDRNEAQDQENVLRVSGKDGKTFETDKSSPRAPVVVVTSRKDRESSDRAAAGAGDPPPLDKGSSNTNSGAEHDMNHENNTNVRSSSSHRHRRGRGERPGSSSGGADSEHKHGAVIKAWAGAKERAIADIQTPDQAGVGRHNQQHSNTNTAGGSQSAIERRRLSPGRGVRRSHSRERSRRKQIRSNSRGSMLSRYSMSSLQKVDEVSEEDWSLSPANQRTRAQREAALEEAARMRPSLSSNDESLSRRSSESSESAPSELAPMSMASSTERRLGSDRRRPARRYSDYDNPSSSRGASVNGSAKGLTTSRITKSYSMTASAEATTLSDPHVIPHNESAGAICVVTPGRSARGTGGRLSANGTPSRKGWREQAKIRRALVLAAAQTSNQQKLKGSSTGVETGAATAEVVGHTTVRNHCGASAGNSKSGRDGRGATNAYTRRHSTSAIPAGYHAVDPLVPRAVAGGGVVGGVKASVSNNNGAHAVAATTVRHDAAEASSSTRAATRMKKRRASSSIVGGSNNTSGAGATAAIAQAAGANGVLAARDNIGQRRRGSREGTPTIRTASSTSGDYPTANAKSNNGDEKKTRSGQQVLQRQHRKSGGNAEGSVVPPSAPRMGSSSSSMPIPALVAPLVFSGGKSPPLFRGSSNSNSNNDDKNNENDASSSVAAAPSLDHDPHPRTAPVGIDQMTPKIAPAPRPRSRIGDDGDGRSRPLGGLTPHGQAPSERAAPAPGSGVGDMPASRSSSPRGILMPQTSKDKSNAHDKAESVIYGQNNPKRATATRSLDVVGGDSSSAGVSAFTDDDGVFEVTSTTARSQVAATSPSSPAGRAAATGDSGGDDGGNNLLQQRQQQVSLSREGLEHSTTAAAAADSRGGGHDSRGAGRGSGEGATVLGMQGGEGRSAEARTATATRGKSSSREVATNALGGAPVDGGGNDGGGNRMRGSQAGSTSTSASGEAAGECGTYKNDKRARDEGARHRRVRGRERVSMSKRNRDRHANSSNSVDSSDSGSVLGYDSHESSSDFEEPYGSEPLDLQRFDSESSYAAGEPSSEMAPRQVVTPQQHAMMSHALPSDGDQSVERGKRGGHSRNSATSSLHSRQRRHHWSGGNGGASSRGHSAPSSIFPAAKAEAATPSSGTRMTSSKDHHHHLHHHRTATTSSHQQKYPVQKKLVKHKSMPMAYDADFLPALNGEYESSSMAAGKRFLSTSQTQPSRPTYTGSRDWTDTLTRGNVSRNVVEEACDIYGSLAPDQDRSRGSVDDPRVLDIAEARSASSRSTASSRPRASRTRMRRRPRRRYLNKPLFSDHSSDEVMDEDLEVSSVRSSISHDTRSQASSSNCVWGQGEEWNWDQSSRPGHSQERFQARSRSAEERVDDGRNGSREVGIRDAAVGRGRRG